jgi:hypothetical protein
MFATVISSSWVGRAVLSGSATARTVRGGAAKIKRRLRSRRAAQPLFWSFYREIVGIKARPWKTPAISPDSLPASFATEGNAAVFLFRRLA